MILVSKSKFRISQPKEESHMGISQMKEQMHIGADEETNP
jgi:hypothetical protein